MLIWFLRRGLWDFIAWGKFRFAKPLDIKLPPTKRRHIEPKPMIQAIPQVPLHNVMVCARADIPRDERSLVQHHVFRLQVWLYKTCLVTHAAAACRESTPTRRWR